MSTPLLSVRFVAVTNGNELRFLLREPRQRKSEWGVIEPQQKPR
jgi:hypothetical protein